MQGIDKANRKKRRTTKARIRKGESAVIPLNTGANLRLSETERLQMENLTLKIQMIQSNAKEQASPILAAREQLGASIGNRLGINIGSHSINLDTGEVTPHNPNPAPEIVKPEPVDHAKDQSNDGSDQNAAG